MGRRLIEKGNEKFDNAGQFERSRCWAIPGNAFAGVGRSWVVGVEFGGQCRPASVGLGRPAGLRKRSGGRRQRGGR